MEGAVIENYQGLPGSLMRGKKSFRQQIASPKCE